MFPSTNYTSSSPYPCFPSSSSSSLYPPFTFLNLENASANNTFHHIHDPVLSVPYIPTTTPHHHHAAIPETLTNWAVSDCSASMLKQDLSVSHYGISNFLTKKPAKKAVKKDRHSKIHTSQGLRDRRVRLSIDIARKFFDLQDMLGFDKASNTLDWLFTKSKKAIEELTRSKSTSNNDNDNDDDTLSSSEGEVVSLINNQQKVMDPNKERKLKRAKMKEPKGKERTRIVEEEEEQERYPENPQTLHQLMRSSPFHSQLVGSELPRNDDHEDDDEFNVIEESIVIKRKKVKQSSISSSSHHHQNIVIPKETSFNNSDSNNSFPMSPNWDANGRSNFCAIATMNLSTGLQIFGKSWEECTSPHLY